MAEAALWTIGEIAAATGGTVEGAPPDALTGVSIDSRTIAPGEIFVAIRGDRHDGHDFAAGALRAGAGVAVVSRPSEEMRTAGALLVVDDPLAALERMGRAARSRSQARIIAVTGSVGKTTTKDALKCAMSRCGETHASVSSFNNHWGVPLTLARLPQGARYGVFEIGMNHAGEIEALVDMVRPHVAVVTAIAESHLGHFSSLAGIAEAKAEIFTGVVDGGSAIINQDSEFFSLLGERARASGISDIRGFGEADGADIRLERATLHERCSCVSANVCGEMVTYKLGAPGKHVVLNSLAVLGACAAAGADLAKCALALADIRPPKGRGGRYELKVDGVSVTLIDESYNANPASMRAALAMLGAAAPSGRGRRIAVLGDMLELGAHAERLHAELADSISDNAIDTVFACGDHMQALWSALPKAVRGQHAGNSQQLIEPVLEYIHSGDIVMVKGSLGSRMTPIVEAIAKKYGGPEGAS